jgi:hypothetical protein
VSLGPSEKRLAEVLRELIKLTRDDKIAWTEGDSSYSFTFATPVATIFLESVDKDGAAPYRLTLLNPDGVQLESLDLNRNSEFWDEDEGRVWDDLETLYDLARRQALDIDNTLDSLMAELKERETDEPPF